MAIKLTQLKPASTKSYIYSDLHLDIEEISVRKNGNDSAYGTDIRADYDIYSIRNSIKSIFNTRRGQRLLYPTFGTFLDEFLFEPISDRTARRIGDAIYNGITKFENRVQVQNITITPMYDDNMYVVNITLYIPILDINTETTAQLTQEGFTLL